MTWTYVERNEDYVVLSFYKVCSDEMRKKAGAFFFTHLQNPEAMYVDWEPIMT